MGLLRVETALPRWPRAGGADFLLMPKIVMTLPRSDRGEKTHKLAHRLSKRLGITMAECLCRGLELLEKQTRGRKAKRNGQAGEG